MERLSKPGLKWYWPAALGALAAIILLFWVPTPYIVYQPGTAERTFAMVETPNKAEEEGEFLLTTVRWSQANVFTFVMSQWNPNAEIFEKSLILGDESRTEYTKRQSVVMQASQGSAIEAAYRALNIPYEVRSEEVVVLSVIEGFSAEGVLAPGDRILAVDGREITSGENLMEALKGKQAGDSIEVDYERRGAEKTSELVLLPLPNSDPPRPGMGISYGTIQRIVSGDPADEVTIHVGSIGGPSAGLMFSLEIYNQLSPENIAKGYRIAGTGEITPTGEVGDIGGVAHKVVAAHREEADIFFVPPGNAAKAAEKAAEIGTNMDIVPVGSLEEALRYLETLPPKDERTGGV